MRIDRTVLLIILMIQILKSETIINQCFTNIPPYGNLCVKGEQTGCYIMNGSVSLGNQNIIMRNFSIPQLVYDNYERNNSFIGGECFNFGPNGICKMCLNSNNVTIDKKLGFCGNINISCQGLMSRSFDSNCININNCTIFACPNQCNNNGQCVDGLCSCNESFYGPDCSIKIGVGNISAPFLPSDIFWNASINNCNVRVNIQFNGTTLRSSQTLPDLRFIQLAPCQTAVGIDNNCQFCLVMNNFTIRNSSNLYGCLGAQYKCYNRDVYRFNLGCQLLLQSEELKQCQTSPTRTSPTRTSQSNSIFTTNSRSSSTQTISSTGGATSTRISTSIIISSTSSQEKITSNDLSTVAKITIVFAVIIIISVVIGIIYIRRKRSQVDFQYDELVFQLEKNENNQVKNGETDVNALTEKNKQLIL
jgi:hypothetical protein